MTPNERRALRALRAECKRTDATLTVDRGFGTVDLRVTAPAGYSFGDLHEFVDACYQPWHPDYQDMLERLRAQPPEKCTVVDCDWCNEEDPS